MMALSLLPRASVPPLQAGLSSTHQVIADPAAPLVEDGAVVNGVAVTSETEPIQVEATLLPATGTAGGLSMPDPVAKCPFKQNDLPGHHAFILLAGFVHLPFLLFFFHYSPNHHPQILCLMLIILLLVWGCTVQVLAGLHQVRRRKKFRPCTGISPKQGRNFSAKQIGFRRLSCGSSRKSLGNRLFHRAGGVRDSYCSAPA